MLTLMLLRAWSKYELVSMPAHGVFPLSRLLSLEFPQLLLRSRITSVFLVLDGL